MTGIEIIALVMVAAWLAVLTVALLLCIRQIALLGLRLENLPAGFSFADDGLDVGAEIPVEVGHALPGLLEGPPTYLLLVSAGCIPCRQLIIEMAEHRLPPRLVTLLSGSDDVAESLVALLPPGATVVRDPDAAALAGLLEIQSTPFAMEITEGVVSGKAFLSRFDDLEELVGSEQARDQIQPDSYQMEVVGRGARS